MKRPRLHCGFLLLAIASVSCLRDTDSRLTAQTARVVQRELTTEILATGAVRPQVGAEVNVGPRISGLLMKLGVQVGDHVRPGQLLAELDHTDLDVMVREAEAKVAEAAAERDLTAGQLRRREELMGKGLISHDELEISRHAALLAAARVDRAKAQLEAARIRRGYAAITAPIGGTVTSIATREGETVAASFAVPTFLTIMDLDRLQVEAFVDEVDIGRVHIGQTARFTVDAFPKEEFEARVKAVVPQATIRENVIKYTVILSISGGDKGLVRPDMSALVMISTGSKKTVLLLPSEAIQRDVDGHSYVLMNVAGKEVRRDISIGQLVGTEVRIRSGIEEGEEVLVPRRNGEYR